MLGRFDLPSSHCAAFALDELTAALETVARRNALAISRAALAQRELLLVRTNAPLTLADLRPHTAAWPLLIADRYGPTQALSAHALANRYDGVVYWSAQQHLGDKVGQTKKSVYLKKSVIHTYLDLRAVHARKRKGDKKIRRGKKQAAAMMSSAKHP